LPDHKLAFLTEVVPHVVELLDDGIDALLELRTRQIVVETCSILVCCPCWTSLVLDTAMSARLNDTATGRARSGDMSL